MTPGSLPSSACVWQEKTLRRLGWDFCCSLRDAVVLVEAIDHDLPMLGLKHTMDHEQVLPMLFAQQSYGGECQRLLYCTVVYCTAHVLRASVWFFVLTRFLCHVGSGALHWPTGVYRDDYRSPDKWYLQ